MSPKYPKNRLPLKYLRFLNFRLMPMFLMNPLFPKNLMSL
jgi:hypothetical protein